MTLTLTGDWKKLEKLLTVPYFTKTLMRNMEIATKRICLMYRSDVRGSIKGGMYNPNAPMTAEIKGSKKPLVDDGDLCNSITYEVSATRTAIEGATGIKKSAVSDGKKLYNIAQTLHEGVKIPVTQKMRNYFRARVYAGDRGWRILSPETTAIVIPPRPFFAMPLANVANQKKYKDQWREAIDKTFESTK